MEATILIGRILGPVLLIRGVSIVLDRRASVECLHQTLLFSLESRLELI